MESEQIRTHRKLHSLLAIFGALSLIFFSSTARAQSNASTADPQEQRLKSLEERLAGLEQEIGSLKQELKTLRNLGGSPASTEPRLVLASTTSPQATNPAAGGSAAQAPAQ